MTNKAQAKLSQGYTRQMKTCANCANYTSEIRTDPEYPQYVTESYRLCSVGGFVVHKTATCDLFTKDANVRFVHKTDMKTLIFQRQFVPLILSGSQSTTIRKQENILCAGERVQFAVEPTHQRYLDTEAFCKTTIARRLDVMLTRTKASLNFVMVKDLETLAINEGFSSYSELVEWFERHYYLPFYGVQLEWTPIIPTCNL